MLESTVRSKLEQAAGKPGIVDEPLARYTTLGCGGPAAFLVEVESPGTLAAVLDVARSESLPFFVLGRGSNLLVADDGWDGFVIRLGGELKSLTVNGTGIDAGAAVSLSKLAAAAASAGLSGLEPLALIPGSLGGAVAMNASAYGTAISDLLVLVELCLPGVVQVKSREEITFDYRGCRLPPGAVVSRVRLGLAATDEEDIRQAMKEFQLKRSNTQPVGSRSCGSVFKNPDEGKAAVMLDQAGCKGLQAGDAEVSTVHANFIINKGNATAADVVALMDQCRRLVFDQSGIILEPEVRFLGDLCLEPLA